MKTTQHTHAPSWGRRVSDCPRCSDRLVFLTTLLAEGMGPKRRVNRRLDALRHASISLYRSEQCGCGPVRVRFDKMVCDLRALLGR
jgi:hypothetical protein